MHFSTFWVSMDMHSNYSDFCKQKLLSKKLWGKLKTCEFRLKQRHFIRTENAEWMKTTRSSHGNDVIYYIKTYVFQISTRFLYVSLAITVTPQRIYHKNSKRNRWSNLAWASSSVWSVMVMICCRMSPISCRRCCWSAAPPTSIPPPPATASCMP